MKPTAVREYADQYLQMRREAGDTRPESTIRVEGMKDLEAQKAQTNGTVW